jgi:hypothetical protein
MSVPLTSGMARDIEAMTRADGEFVALDAPAALERWRELGAPPEADLAQAQRAFLQMSASAQVWETLAWELQLRIGRLEAARVALAGEDAA